MDTRGRSRSRRTSASPGASRTWRARRAARAADYGARALPRSSLAPVALRMRQSLGELERAFFEEAEADRLRRERLYRQAAARSSKRRIERSHKKGSLRFVVLVLVLLATAALVTVAMFRALYILLG